MNINILERNDLSSLEEKVNKILHLLEEAAGTGRSEWMRSSDVKKMLHVSDATLKNYRDSGKLKFSKVGGTYYYSAKDISNVLNQQNFLEHEK